MVISFLINTHGGGGGGCFTWGCDIQKFAEKRSSVSTVLQPIVARSYKQLIESLLCLTTELEMPNVEIMPAAFQTVTGGETAIFRCVIKAGVPEPSIKWSAEEDGAWDEHAHAKDDGVLRISPASGEDQGKYVCKATNVLGSMEAVATLTVLGKTWVQIVGLRGVGAGAGAGLGACVYYFY